MESVLDTLGREADFGRVSRNNTQSPSSSALVSN